MEYLTYILYTTSLDCYCVGLTKDMVERLNEHLWNYKGFTSTGKDWAVVYTERYDSKSEAYA